MYGVSLTVFVIILFLFHQSDFICPTFLTQTIKTLFVKRLVVYSWTQCSCTKIRQVLINVLFAILAPLGPKFHCCFKQVFHFYVRATATGLTILWSCWANKVGSETLKGSLAHLLMLSKVLVVWGVLKEFLSNFSLALFYFEKAWLIAYFAVK